MFYYFYCVLVEVFEILMYCICVIKFVVGGGFGGKSDLFLYEIVCVMLVWKTCWLVKIMFDCEEVFLLNYGCYLLIILVKMGVDKEGIM